MSKQNLIIAAVVIVALAVLFMANRQDPVPTSTNPLGNGTDAPGNQPTPAAVATAIGTGLTSIVAGIAGAAS